MIEATNEIVPATIAAILPSLDTILAALDRTGQTWLRRVDVSIETGNVVLRGRVPSFYLKQLAQVTVLAVPGVLALRNELEVVKSG